MIFPLCLSTLQTAVSHWLTAVRSHCIRANLITQKLLGLLVLRGQVVVVGDSYAKDIVPAHTIGCHTVWLKGIGWSEEKVDEALPDAIIADLVEIPETIDKINKR